MRLDGGQLVVEMLKAYEVQYVFGVPGDTGLVFYDALYQAQTRGEINHVLARDERSAAFIADVYARVSFRPGVCEGPSGAGATYLAAGLAEPHASSIPVIALNSDTPLSNEDRNVLTALDQPALFAPITKWRTVVKRADRIPDVMRQAFRIATSGRPGAVQVTLPMDVLADEADAPSLHAEEPCRGYPAYRTRPDPAAVERAANLLLQARQPVIVAGGGVVTSGAWAELTDLAEALGVPVRDHRTAAGGKVAKSEARERRMKMPRIVVIGGGWAGCAAALSAKKAGAEVVLVEKTDCLLGTGLVGGIMRNNGRFTAAEEMIAMGGGDLFRLADQAARHTNVEFPGHKHANLYDVALMEPLVRRHLLEQGVELWLMSRACEVIKTDGRIEAVRMETGEQLEGDAFVETTGTAGPQGNCRKYGNGCAMCILRCPSWGGRVSIAARAGVKEMMGRKADGSIGAMSGSCKLHKDSVDPAIVAELNRSGVAVVRKDIKAHTVTETEYLKFEEEKAAAEAREYAPYARVAAWLVPLAFLVDVIVLILLEIRGGDATAVLGDTALILLAIFCIWEHGWARGAEQVTDCIREGFMFGMKVFAPVFLVAGFYLMGVPGHAEAIFGDAGKPLIIDIIKALTNVIPINKVIVGLMHTVLSGITGLDGSGFNDLPLMGALAASWGQALGLKTATLAALGQISMIWIGGGTIVPWAVLPVSAITGVPAIDLCRKNFWPCIAGVFAATIVAIILM